MIKPTQAQIEAAAKVLKDMCDWMGDEQWRFVNDEQSLEMAAAAITAAAEVGRIGQADRCCECGAERKFWDEKYVDIDSFYMTIQKQEAATKERCARVAENFQGHDSDDARLFIAAAIRALKDKP